jgi:hypothetical protein
MISFFAGILYVNAGEWFIHRYVLHGLGKKKDSFWNFHWKDHHHACRKNDMLDNAYSSSSKSKNESTSLNPQEKETLMLCLAALGHLPLAVISPGFVSGVLFSIASYYFLHKLSHIKPNWAKKWLPWHYEHHMMGNQEHSWCVTFPLLDTIFRTRWIDKKR